jgi:hypothetical protein
MRRDACFSESPCSGYALEMKNRNISSFAVNRILQLLSVLALLCFAAISGWAADNPAADAHNVPSVDGGVGPCSVDFTVKDASGAPVYDSKINVHVVYGVFHKMDLQVGTNVDGKGRFSGLPSRVKRPMEFVASKADSQGSATYDPASEACTAVKTITLSKAASSTQP